MTPLTFAPGSKSLLRSDFQDLSKSRCSIQESSKKDESAIWLGVSEDLEGRPSTRMHLSQSMVKELLPLLQTFATTGYLNSPQASASADSSPSKFTHKSKAGEKASESSTKAKKTSAKKVSKAKKKKVA